MPIRLVLIPIFLAAVAAMVAVMAWHVEMPAAPTQSSTQKMAVVEANVEDIERRWVKAKEIVNAEVAVSEAERSALMSGLKVYRWSVALVALLSLLQIWLTYEWWKESSKNV